MPRYTSAYSSFATRLNEIDILRRAAIAKERKDPVLHRNEINALCRGGIVLLSARLEAYIKELGELVLLKIHSAAVDRSKLADQFFFYASQDLIREIADSSEPDGIANKIFRLLARDTALWSKSGPLPSTIDPRRFSNGFSNPAFKKVSAYFGRFGYSSYKGDLQAHLAADFLPVINMVEQLVGIRNLIAHGDPTATRTPAELADMVGLIRNYCRATDTVFANWCRNHLCAIR